MTDRSIDAPGVVVDPRGEKGEPVPGAGRLGMLWFLASLSMLFAASLIGFLVVRTRTDAWRPDESPMPVGGLLIGTALLVAAGVTAQKALAAIRAGDSGEMRRKLGSTAILAVSFLCVQAWNGSMLLDGRALAAHGLYGFTFLMLTGLHALHLVGGLVGLAVVVRRARSGSYTWAGHAGVQQLVLYWHFLGAVWVVVLAVLLLGN